MNIRVEEPKMVQFSLLSLGDVFKYKNNYYLKIEMIEAEHDDDINAISLRDGCGCSFIYSDLVELVEHELIIK